MIVRIADRGITRSEHDVLSVLPVRVYSVPLVGIWTSEEKAVMYSARSAGEGRFCPVLIKGRS